MIEKENFVLMDRGLISESPVVTRERFAEMVGLPIGVILGWCARGYLPQIGGFGKYRLINLELLRKQCLAEEFEQ